eukprot:Skav230633  [mRNA]  locus=scaffold1673:259549:261405:+ [translate_table: standard]
MYPLKGLLTLRLFVAVHGVDLPDIVGYLTNPVAWFRGRLHDPLVHQPKKLMPTVHTLQHMTQHESEERLHFFMALFFVIFFTTIILGTVIMTVGPRMKACVGSSYRPLSSSRSGRVKRVSEEGHAVDLEWQRTLVAISFAATLTSCTATCIWSLRTSTLSKKTGLDWEMYALLLAGGGAAVVIQAIFAVKWLPKGRTFGIFAFAEGACVSLAPFISDAFDTLKDTIFCFLCFQSQFLVLKVIGAVSWLYLVVIHIFFVRSDDTLAELAGCYLPVLSALPKPEVRVDNHCCESGWNAALLLLYKQTTPTKRKLLVIENLPQALFSIIFLFLEGGSIFVGVINLGIPVAQIGAAVVFFRPLRHFVAPQLGKKLSAFLKKPDFLKAKQLWEEVFRGDDDLIRKALPQLREAPLVKKLLKELKPKQKDGVGRSCLPCWFFASFDQLQGARPQDAVEDAELDPNTDEGLEIFGRGLEAAIENQGDLRSVPDAVAATGWTEYETGICYAAFQGDIAAVRAFLYLDAAAVQRSDAFGYTALHQAAMSGQAEVVQVLLAAKASVEARNGYDITPLMIAAERNYIEVAKLLLAARASPHLANDKGETPLSRAKERNHSEMVRLLEAA